MSKQDIRAEGMRIGGKTIHTFSVCMVLPQMRMPSARISCFDI